MHTAMKDMDLQPQDPGYWQTRTCPVCWTEWTGNPVARKQQGCFCSTCWRQRSASKNRRSR